MDSLNPIFNFYPQKYMRTRYIGQKLEGPFDKWNEKKKNTSALLPIAILKQ